jgi:hypothetical protein
MARTLHAWPVLHTYNDAGSRRRGRGTIAARAKRLMIVGGVDSEVALQKISALGFRVQDLGFDSEVALQKYSLEDAVLVVADS